MKKIFTYFFLLISLSIFGQSYTIDLAKNINDTYKRTVQSNKQFNLLIKNKLPFKEYNIEITKKAIPIEKFNLPSTQKGINTSGGGAARCARFITDVYKIYELEKEEDLPTIIKSINNDIKNIEDLLSQKDTTDEGCSTSHILEAKEILKLTDNIEIWDGKLKQGEQLEIVITRNLEGETRKWTYTYTTEPKGEWQVTYGFSFITQGFNEENIYFSSSVDNKYIIKKEKNRKSMSFAPSTFFSWMPIKALYKSWSLGISGGLGFDFENPTVFLCPTLSYNQNLKLHLGVVAHKQSVLLGKYEEGQIINEDLSKDQLHEQLYKLNPFVSLSFRFNENPFNKQK